uniref:SWIM-type domain-containing protein n=1 Tax=Trepomonas sp. PC1 TaxID=1076344 RepID=A0A146JXP2_9EUKA|eukprot:JAP89432.1 Hypothetical protein TPC1_31073 [Trepomonas sp. PC1]
MSQRINCELSGQSSASSVIESYNNSRLKRNLYPRMPLNEIFEILSCCDHFEECALRNFIDKLRRRRTFDKKLAILVPIKIAKHLTNQISLSYILQLDEVITKEEYGKINKLAVISLQTENSQKTHDFVVEFDIFGENPADGVRCTCCTKLATKMICVHEIMALKHLNLFNYDEILKRCDEKLNYRSYKDSFQILIDYKPQLLQQADVFDRVQLIDHALTTTQKIEKINVLLKEMTDAQLDRCFGLTKIIHSGLYIDVASSREGGNINHLPKQWNPKRK